METEAAALPTRGNHEESSGGDRRVAAAGCARSFDCAFCKRGFSNAQALGGHMNMHRKDRAKLKAPSSRCCRFPFDVSGSSVAAASATYAPVVVVVERSTPPRQPAGYSGGRASWCSAPAAPLALFAERAAWGGDGDDDGGGGRGGGGRRGIDEERRGHEAELDLELRLGRSETYLRSSKESN